MESKVTYQPGRSLVRFLCSIRFTVFLLVALAAILAAATVLESCEGTGAVQMKVYRAAWFNLFLLAFTINMLGGTYKRFRWLWVHLGFAVTHLGVFTIILGAFLTRNFGIEGQMTIPEGETRAYFIGNDDKLTALVNKGEESASLSLPIDRGSKQRELWLSDRLPKSGLTVVLDRYYSDLQFDSAVEEGGGEENPAVEYKIAAMGVDSSGWLLSRVPGREQVDMGPLSVRLVEGRLPLSSAGSTSPTGPNVLVLSDAAGKQSVEVQAVAGKTAKIELGGKPPTVTVKQVFFNFTMDGKEFSDRGGEPDNPAVAFSVAGPAGTSADLAFSKYPDFNLQHGKASTIYRARYVYRGGAEESSGNRVTIYLQDGALSYGLKMGRRAAEIGALQPGKPVGLLDGRIELTVVRTIAKGRLAQRAINGSDEARNPAIHVKVVPASGQEGAGVWIPWGEEREVSVAGKTVALGYRGDRHDVPFALELLKFKEEKYPGTNSPATYESKVSLKDAELGASRELVISMNEPLLYRGYTFFQSSYIPGDRYATVLSVARDPGKWPTYVGYVLMVLGVVMMFYCRPFLARWDQANLKKEKS